LLCFVAQLDHHKSRLRKNSALPDPLARNSCKRDERTGQVNKAARLHSSGAL
jgi:hypothetical protein